MKSRALLRRFTLVLAVYGALVLGLWFGYHKLAFASIRSTNGENIALTTDRLLTNISADFSDMKVVASVIAGSVYVQDFLMETDVAAYFEKATVASEIVSKAVYPMAVVDSVITMTNGGDFYRFTGSVSNQACQKIFASMGKGGEVQSVVDLDGTLYFCYLSPVVITQSGAPKRIGSVVLLNELQKTRRSLETGRLTGVDTVLLLDGVVLLSNQRSLEGQRLETLAAQYGEVNEAPVDGTSLTVAGLVTRSTLHAGQRLFLLVSAAMLALSLAMLALLYRYLKRSMLTPLLQTKDEMQMGLLSTQMDAHLVFNSISCIQTLAQRGDNEKAAQVAAGLAAILKHQHLGGNLVNTFVELEALERYIEIMNLRHEDRYRVDFDVEDTLADYLMPSGILQPIVENALTHGLRYQTGPCRLHIQGALSDGNVRFVLSDNGAGMPPDVLEALREKLRRAQESDFPEQGLQGVALINIQKRLLARYGVPFGIAVDSTQGGGTTVRVTLPALIDK